MGSFERLFDVFNFKFDDVQPLIFTQLNFWLFFIFAFGVYTLLDIQRKYRLAISIGFGLAGVVLLFVGKQLFGYGGEPGESWLNLHYLDVWLLFLGALFFVASRQNK